MSSDAGHAASLALNKIKTEMARHDHLVLGGVPDGFESLVLGEVIEASPQPVIFVARDARRLNMVREALTFFNPGRSMEIFPAWDCLPYDRVSPNAEISAQRISTLYRLANSGHDAGPDIILTTANAIIQKVPDRASIMDRAWIASAGQVVDMAGLTAWLQVNGFDRTPTVRTVGEYAVRGGIVDLFAPGFPEPIRLDFFGDTLESIRPFDPATQRTLGQIPNLDLLPASEAILSEETISRFRKAYRADFGAVTGDDALYTAISEGRRFAGMEHWLPYFFERLENLMDYLPASPIVLDHLADEAMAERFDQINDHYQSRIDTADTASGAGTPYKPIAPEKLYFGSASWAEKLVDGRTVRLSPFAEVRADTATFDLGGRTGRSFAAERASGSINVFEALVDYIGELAAENKRIVLAAWSEGARERMGQVLVDHGLTELAEVSGWQDLQDVPLSKTALTVLPVEAGYQTDEFVIIGDQDILGDRLIRGGRKRKRASDALTDATSLAAGDLVVHVDHGIGQFNGLKTIDAAGAPHDCLELSYFGGDRLFLPVENIELLTRYGGEEAGANLDRLGGGGWQSRKAKLKKRIRDIADALIKTAAARLLRKAPVLSPPDGLYDEFATRFPYEETEDQMAAIDATLDDLASGRPMDRLICGDVGFGKTEVALRAAFVAAMNGKQVAVVVPTTLLARQHFRTFTERFSSLPLNIAQASRLVGSKSLAETKKGIASGGVDIAIGTHALLSKGIDFKDLGLLIIDEEQHFGVKHKERLKELRSTVHVLTLSATPIPRTLQLALTGVRDLSLIATPPVDRLAVRTFVTPFDPMTVREAILRERLRGGQSFFVVPRIADLGEIEAFLRENVPEARLAVAHGQMAPGALDDVMNAFYDGKYDVLLSTTIVESGLDIPTANTLVVHRSDMFGLSQLYQLRGRIGRSKTRAYSLFTVPANKKLTATADRRLKVLQSLDTLGAGFQLASHDLDIRGAGNLLGDEQSGHIKEVGFELYQQMLEEAVANLKDGDDSFDDDRWSPQITIGLAVLIPEYYVPDLQLRMSLYRELADLTEPGDIDDYAAELIDRFGALPNEVEHLLKIVFVKALCRRANVEKVDAGPKGVVIGFRGNEFANPPGLIRYIGDQGSFAKIRPDQRIVFMRDWADGEDRLKGVATILTRLVQLSEESGQEAA